MKLRPGNLIKCKVETHVVHKDSYYTVNKHAGDMIWVDGHNGVFWPDRYFEEDEICKQYNNAKPMEVVKAMKRDAEINVAAFEEPYARINNTVGAPAKVEGTKKDAGKSPISLIPSEYIEGTAAVFGFGANKYGRDNFRQGLAWSRCLDAASRHILAISRGEIMDPESGLPHVYHASCSLAMFDYMRLHHPDLNDLFELKKEK